MKWEKQLLIVTFKVNYIKTVYFKCQKKAYIQLFQLYKKSWKSNCHLRCTYLGLFTAWGGLHYVWWWTSLRGTSRWTSFQNVNKKNWLVTIDIQILQNLKRAEVTLNYTEKHSNLKITSWCFITDASWWVFSISKFVNNGSLGSSALLMGGTFS